MNQQKHPGLGEDSYGISRDPNSNSIHSTPQIVKSSKIPQDHQYYSNARPKYNDGNAIQPPSQNFGPPVYQGQGQGGATEHYFTNAYGRRSLDQLRQGHNARDRRPGGGGTFQGIGQSTLEPGRPPIASGAGFKQNQFHQAYEAQGQSNHP